MAQIYAFTYCIDVWDDCDRNIHTEFGIAQGSSFSEVVKNLEEYYGEQNIESIRELSCFDVGGTYVIPEEGLKDLGYARTVAKEQN